MLYSAPSKSGAKWTVPLVLAAMLLVSCGKEPSPTTAEVITTTTTVFQWENPPPCSTWEEYRRSDDGRGSCWEPIPGGPGITPTGIWHPICEWWVYDHPSKQAAVQSARMHWATNWPEHLNRMLPYVNAAAKAPCGS